MKWWYYTKQRNDRKNSNKIAWEKSAKRKFKIPYTKKESSTEAKKKLTSQKKNAPLLQFVYVYIDLCSFMSYAN